MSAVHDRTTPKTTPISAPTTRSATQTTALIAKVTAIAVTKKVAVAARLAGEPIALPLSPLPRGTAARALRAVTDEGAGHHEDRADDDHVGLAEGLREPAVASEPGAAGEEREHEAAGDDADQEQPRQPTASLRCPTRSTISE